MNLKMSAARVAAVCMAGAAGIAQAACLTDAEVSALVDAYNARTPAANGEGLSLAARSSAGRAARPSACWR